MLPDDKVLQKKKVRSWATRREGQRAAALSLENAFRSALQDLQALRRKRDELEARVREAAALLDSDSDGLGSRLLAAEPPNRRTAEPPNRRNPDKPNLLTAETSNRRTAETPKRRSAETTNRQTAEPPNRRSAEPPKRRNAGTPYCQPATFKALAREAFFDVVSKCFAEVKS